MSIAELPATHESIDSEIERQERLFELAQRKAKVYSKSSLVPREYQNNIGNVLIAENMAHRMGADTLMVMQNLYVVHGKPGWSAQFLIACFNSCGRFSAIRFEFSGRKTTDNWGCLAYCTELSTGEVLRGTKITLKMAKAEGWASKAGSKWKTMPEQMLRYRAATFLVRTVAPEIGMGLLTQEELQDMGEESGKRTTSVNEFAKLMGQPQQPKPEPQPTQQFKVDVYDEAIRDATTKPQLLQIAADIEDDEAVPGDVKSELAEFVTERMGQVK